MKDNSLKSIVAPAKKAVSVTEVINAR
jgi:hypothetical protein